MEPPVRQLELEVYAVALDGLVPAVHAALAVGDIIVAEPLVQRNEGRLLPDDDPVAVELGDRVRRVLEPVVVTLLGFLEAALEPHGVEVRRVGGYLGPEQVERHRAVGVDVLLDRRQVDAAVPAHVVALVLTHDLARPLHHAAHAGLADEHVVRLLGQHEPAGTRERVEAALGQARELVLAVAVGEEAEHVEGQPVRRPLVERAEDARLVAVARAALEQGLGLLASIAPEVGIEQIYHRPQVTALLHVDLEDVAQVVEGRAGPAQVALLLHRRRLRVALGDDEPAQRAAVLTGHFLPGRIALVVAEVDGASRLGLRQEDAPAVLRHLDVPELGPALSVDAAGGAQVHLLRLEAVGPHVLPPFEEPGLSFLERPLEPPVLRQVDVVRDPLDVVDAGHHTLLRSNSLRSPVPYTRSAPLGPTAFGRWKIQFCHADSRAKILVSRVSGPPNRSEASMPVSASGEKATRSSVPMRTSSSQSMSSGVKVTRPASPAAAASLSRPKPRLRYRRTSRTSQSASWSSSTRSYASTISELPAVFRTQRPISSSFVRRWRIRSSSSRARQSGQNAAPSGREPGALTVISATPRRRSISQATWL